MALNVGGRLGHYDVTAKVGEGGMGWVYRGRCQRQLQLKVVPTSIALTFMCRRSTSSLTTFSSWMMSRCSFTAHPIEEGPVKYFPQALALFTVISFTALSLAGC